MNFFELIKKRESCRDMTGERVPREKLDAILEAARLTPSACNSQPWKFVVADEPELVSKVADCMVNREIGLNAHVLKAGALIAVLEVHAVLRPRIEKMCGSQFFAQLDVGQSVSYLTLAAAELGLSTSIIGVFEEEKIKALLGIPEEPKIRLMVAVGYAKTPEIREKERKSIIEIAGFNKFR